MPRGRLWQDTRISQTMVSTTGQVLEIAAGSNEGQAQLTVVRMVGHLFFRAQSPNSTNQAAMQCDMGVAVVTTEALVAGIASVPDPTLSTSFPARGWLWRDAIVTEEMNGTGTVEIYKAGELVFDIRSQRKLDRGKLVFIAETNPVTGTGYTTTLHGWLRCLCLT